MATTQISANISVDAKAKLDALARATGRSRQAILEEAIIRESIAIEEIPLEFIVAAITTLDAAAAKALVDAVDRPPKMTATFKRTMRAAGIKVR